MGEEFVRVGEVDLCYEVLGRDTDPTVLLIMGLNLQLVWWRDEFCADLVDRGFRVVRFDNRDVGRSTHFTGGHVGPTSLITRRARAKYSIADMADDAAGLIRHVAPDGAHVVGASLGSFIAQQVAIRHPDLTRSLVSIMGRPGDGRSGKVAPRMLPQFLRSGPSDPDRAIEFMVATFRRIGSMNRTTADDDDVRVAMRRSAARETGSGGTRQFAAAITERDRTADLGKLTVPALVFHGDRDRVIRPSGGQATAAAIPGSELVIVAGMGHDLPRWVWPQLIAAIEKTASRAT